MGMFRFLYLHQTTLFLSFVPVMIGVWLYFTLNIVCGLYTERKREATQLCTDYVGEHIALFKLSSEGISTAFASATNSCFDLCARVDDVLLTFFRFHNSINLDHILVKTECVVFWCSADHWNQALEHYVLRIWTYLWQSQQTDNVVKRFRLIIASVKKTESIFLAHLLTHVCTETAPSSLYV